MQKQSSSLKQCTHSEDEHSTYGRKEEFTIYYTYYIKDTAVSKSMKKSKIHFTHSLTHFSK